MFLLLASFFIGSLSAATSYTCDTKYDVLDIPRVETTSMEGYYYCFGLHHGKDRAWQMDYFRRASQGRNAEVLGFDQLKPDLMMRLLDLPALAEKLWGSFPDSTKKYLEAYSEGVNKGFEKGKTAREFRELGFEPEEWKPQDSLSVLLLQAFDQTRKTFTKDVDEEFFKQDWKEKAEALFDEDNLPWQTTILKDGEYVKREAPKTVEATIEQSIKLWSEFPSVFGLESGSNNWVVSKARSKSKKALLANDPHLDLRTPVFWYWMGIQTPTVKVLGGSVPGVPIMANGTNGKVSWGLTNSYMNAADAIAIKDLKNEQVESIRPFVKIKFWFFKLPFFFKSFEKLKSGHPILPLETEIKDKIALKWVGYNLKAEEVTPMFELFNVQDVTEMDSVTAKIGVPSWNFVFADNKGDIGYRVVGKTYRHLDKTPMGIPSKTYEEFQKDEFFSDSEEPHLLKPKRGFVVTANNRQWPVDSALYAGRAHSYSFRALKIEEMMNDRMDLDEFINIQCDREAIDARFFVPKIQKYLNLPEFSDWQRSSDDSSKILPLYRRLFDLMLERWQVNEYALFKLLDELTPEQVSDLKTLLATARADVADKTWGQMHVVNFPHLSRNKKWVFSPEIPGIGDTHTVDPGTSRWNEERKLYEQNSGASMRMVVEMADVPVIKIVLPGPNRNYAETSSQQSWLDWKNCKFTEIKF